MDNCEEKSLMHGWREIVDNLVHGMSAGSEGLRNEESGVANQKLREFGHDYLSDDLRQNGVWMAKYRRVRDGIPGIVVFHRPRIASFFWATVNHLRAKGVSCDGRLAQLAGMLVFGIYAHEQFHFFCDLRRQLLNDGVLDEEEGLATAWEWRSAQVYGRRVGVPPEVASEAIHWWFDGIVASGYREWKNYVHRCDFLQAAQHVLELPQSVLEFVSWCDYSIIETEGVANRRPACWNGNVSALAVELTEKALALRDDSSVAPPGAKITIDFADQGLAELPPVPQNQCDDRHLLCVRGNDIRFLRNVHKTRKEVGLPGILCLRKNKLESHLLGLIRVKGLKEVRLDDQEIQRIINKHLKEGRNPHECQEDLIYGNYAAYAEI